MVRAETSRIKHMGELKDSPASGKKSKVALCYPYDAKSFTPPPSNGTNARILEAARATEEAGVKCWQVNLRIDASGVSLIRYFRSRPHSSGA